VSYADLVTLLFALFATLYAASSADSEKMAPIVSSLQEAFAMTEAPGEPAGGRASVLDVGALPAPAAEDDLHAQLARELADAIADRRLELMRDARGLVVSLPDDATFPTGSAEATPEARRLIARVGDALRRIPNAIRIEGHTDDVPIRTVRYASNWELSTARASAVVAFLVNDVGIRARRLSAAGYGEFHPRETNDTPGNRARNRRVDLVILDARDSREPPLRSTERDSLPAPLAAEEAPIASAANAVDAPGSGSASENRIDAAP
jgi:chemotaxis protein MotB